MNTAKIAKQVIVSYPEVQDLIRNIQKVYISRGPDQTITYTIIIEEHIRDILEDNKHKPNRYESVDREAFYIMDLRIQVSLLDDEDYFNEMVKKILASLKRIRIYERGHCGCEHDCCGCQSSYSLTSTYSPKLDIIIIQEITNYNY